VDDLKLSSAQAFEPLSNADVSAGAGFARTLASVAAPAPLRAALHARAFGVAGTSGAATDAPALRNLARRLDEIERRRIEAAALPERIARSYAGGASGPEVALAMHRQARLMAAYNLDVMWAARIVGASAGGLRQLIAAA
jgi:hypothetical protein